MKMSIVPLTLYLMKYRVGKCTGINFMDSTTLDVCGTNRISSHKFFNCLSQRGKSSMGGWIQTSSCHQRYGRNSICVSYFWQCR